MRTIIVLASAFASIAIASACASSEEEPSKNTDSPGPTESPGGGDEDGGSGSIADADVPDTRLPDCSPAGWCVTDFPDEDLVFRDIAPFEDVAFAVAESRTVGIKVLEWTKSTRSWTYIDDGTQNQTGIGTFAGRIYAPNVDELYFTVGPSYVFHGKRSGGAWTWTKQALPDGVTGHTESHGNPLEGGTREPVTTLGVWGTGAGDVYAYFSNTIFHRDPLSGSFDAVYVADDGIVAADEHIFFTAVDGSGPDDLWFVGARHRTTAWTTCPLVVRKSAAGWERVADAIVSNSQYSACAERAGTLRIGPSPTWGWLRDVARVSSTEYVALQYRRSGTFPPQEDAYATTIRVTDDGYTFEQSLVPVRIATSGPRITTSFWRGDGETWFTSWGLVLRGTEDGTFSVSTLSRSGAPVLAPFYRIRGTSNQNLWAIGARHAYHKTTP